MKLLTSHRGCDVKARDVDGKTAMDIARGKGFKEFVKYLDAI